MSTIFLKNLATVFLTVFILLFSSPAAAYHEGRSYFDTFTLYWENDFFVNTDRNYTNGIKLTWSTPIDTVKPQSSHLPEWSEYVINKLPLVNDPSTKRAVSVSLGQNIYTPDNTREADVVENERPYAGYAYAAAGFHNKDARRQNTWEFDIGVVGPLSAAGKIQGFVHDVTGSPRAQGWEHQLGNELAVGAIYESKWKLFQFRNYSGLGFDSFYHLGGRLGNVFTYANTGIQFRLGLDMPDNFGSCPIRAGCETNNAFNDPRSNAELRDRLNFHFFAGVDGRAVARNIFLDGNTFQDSHHVDKEPFVVNVLGGIALKKGRFQTTYSLIYTSKEYTSQKNAQVFGAITVSVSF